MRDLSIEEVGAAADEFARRLAGEDDRQRAELFIAALNLGDLAQRAETEALDPGEVDIGRVLFGDTSPVGVGNESVTELVAGAAASRVHADPVWARNVAQIIASGERIINGQVDTQFPDCVAVGGAGQWCCTGTLVAPNVVVTAAHCVDGGCSARIFVGPDVDQPQAGEVIGVASAVAHPDYATREPFGDIAVLVLEDDVTGVTPRALAPAGALAGEASVRLVGYGTTDIAGSTGYGIRRVVDVPLASDAPVGQEPATEFVAGEPFLNRDSCNGDSGGPAYIEVGGRWLLAGATSRAVPGLRNCGDGGIYTTVAAYADWIRGIPGGHWG